MVTEYNINDLVVYEDGLYRIIGVYQMNHQISDPHVYELGRIDRNTEEYSEVIFVRGALLVKTKAVEILYEE